MTMDPRFERRRRTVREHSVQRRLRVILWVCILGVVIGGVAWLVQSPLLEVRDIGIYGAERSSVGSILDAAGLHAGVPMLRVHPGKITAMLEEDPWVLNARVARTFPHTVEIEVRERTVAAGVQTGESWVLLSSDGVVLGAADHVPDGAALLLLGDVVPGIPGATPKNQMVAGALEFVTTLDPAMWQGTVVEIRDGELWARTSSVSARLGSPLEMSAKARALQAVLDSGVPPGTMINLIAPSRPAVESSS
jgi:cell division septal protein FtsQ